MPTPNRLWLQVLQVVIVATATSTSKALLHTGTCISPTHYQRFVNGLSHSPGVGMSSNKGGSRTARKRASSTLSIAKTPKISHEKKTTKKPKATASASPQAPSDNSSLLKKWIHHKNADFHHFSPEQSAKIRLALLEWYRTNRRKLPWRGDPPPFDGSTATAASNSKTNNSNDYNLNATQIPFTAYGVWVSEIMLQQTRVEAVIPFYLKWMQSFPTIQHLAEATPEQVNSHWAGLGFYRRARLLHSAAQHVVQHHKGQLPRTVKELQTIPGVGPYTASAISSIAFGVCVPVVDGNVCRVLARLTGIANHIKAPALKDKGAWEMAQQIVQAGNGQDAGQVNQAMMELGATYCAPSGTGVDEGDPLKDFYMSTKIGEAFYKEYYQQDGSFEETIQQQLTASSCTLCHETGVANVLEQLTVTLEEQLPRSDDPIHAARRCGHSVFPTAPPKLSKRHEILAMAVISAVSNGDNNQTFWLLVKRPKTGLLAGQWEFPSACLWNSNDDDDDDKKKTRVKRTLNDNSKQLELPTIAATVKRKALKALLREALDNDTTTLSAVESANMSSLKGSPLVHIFSHVQHYMLVEYTTLKDFELSQTTWIASSGRECRWMRSEDMAEAGVTSGVKKVLKAVAEEKKKSNQKQAFFQPRKRNSKA
jgi:A/G-specific adenine glycosylase